MAGPYSVRNGRQDYNQALQITEAQQLLLNLVRLRYLDPPFFLDVRGITAQYTLEGRVGFSADVENAGVTGSTLKPSLGVTGSERPTVSYAPLHGEEFAETLLRPLSADELLLLANGGWGLERLLRLTVDRLGPLRNATSATGPGAERAPEYQEFLRVVRVLGELHARGQVDVGGELDADGTVGLELAIHPEAHEDFVAITDALGVSPDTRRLRLQPGTGALGIGTVAYRARPLLAVLYYLSHAVDVPEQDEVEGRVVVTRGPGGERFDWDAVLGGLMDVRCEDLDEVGTLVEVEYRGVTFGIRDDDLDSKRTFLLLTQLVALQAGRTQGHAPMLVLPLGG